MTAPQLSTHIRTFAPEETADWGAVLAAARRYDEAGIDRVVVSDHVVFGERLEEYGRPEIGGRAGGTQPTGPDGAWLEPLIALAFVAASTTRIRIGTNIVIAALRRPVVLAKQAATLDILSGGRLDLGVGVGWQREEYEAAGLDFDGRGRLLEHTLEVCRTLWTERRAAYDAPELRFEKIHMMPKPVQPGGVPVWVSGTVHKPVVRRLARFGAGWIPWGPDADDPPRGIARMREALDAVGHDHSRLQIVGQAEIVEGADGRIDVDRTLEPVPELVEAGVTDVRLPLDPETSLDDLRTLVAAFRAAVGRTAAAA
ncbi:MAG: TIGR03619 family F420-dependent LLM class oxidoreductase [Actinomycetota bacterium]